MFRNHAAEFGWTFDQVSRYHSIFPGKVGLDFWHIWVMSSRPSAWHVPWFMAVAQISAIFHDSRYLQLSSFWQLSSLTLILIMFRPSHFLTLSCVTTVSHDSQSYDYHVPWLSFSWLSRPVALWTEIDWFPWCGGRRKWVDKLNFGTLHAILWFYEGRKQSSEAVG